MSLKKQSTYQKSQLITHDYLGCSLGTEFYRENNVVKMNRLLCKALKHQHSVYIFELLDSPNLEEITDVLHELKQQGVYYARMSFDHKVMLAIFTDKGQDYATGIVDSVSRDYTLLYENQLNTEESDLEEISFNLYQLCLHVADTFQPKSKRFSSTNLECNDKELSLAFKKQAVIYTDAKQQLAEVLLS